MKTSNVEGHGSKAVDATRGRRTALLAGAKGMVWRDASTESVGQVRDMTVIGAEFVDNDDGTGVLIVGGGGFGGGGTGGGGGSGPYSIEEADDLFQTRRGGEGFVTPVTTASGSAVSLDLSTGNWFDITLTDDCTISFTGITDLISGDGYEWTIILRQDAVGGRTVTWPGSVDWQDTDGTGGASAPTLYTAATALDEIIITTLDAGTTYGGAQQRTGGGSSSLTVQDEGTPLATSATTLNFVGGGVVASGAGATKTITIAGGSSASDTNIWRPVIDGAGLVIATGSGEALMAYGPA